MSQPRQQINLYQQGADTRRVPFGADTLAMISGAVIICLLVIWSVGDWRVDGLQRAVRNLQQQQQTQQQTTSELGALLPAGARSGDIESQLHRLQAELDARERALQLLRQGAIGRTSGFSAQLTALARCPMPGLWLQRVAIEGVSGAMSLAGDAAEPDIVPQYLRELAGQSALSGVRFDRLVIERQRPRPMKSTHGAAAIPLGPFAFSADGVSVADVRVAEAQEMQP